VGLRKTIKDADSGWDLWTWGVKAKKTQEEQDRIPQKVVSNRRSRTGCDYPNQGKGQHSTRQQREESTATASRATCDSIIGGVLSGPQLYSPLGRVNLNSESAVSREAAGVKTEL